MLRLQGIFSLERMTFGDYHCHCHHIHYRRLSNFLGRSILLGMLLGLFLNRARENSEEYFCYYT